MKTLIEAVEEWIDQRISSVSGIGELEARFKDMAEIQSRDALTIEGLQKRLSNFIDLNSSGDSYTADAGESMFEGDQALEEFKNTIEDLESRFNDLESEVEDAQSAIEDIPDAYSIEVMIDDAVETKVMDAVMAELDSIDFKVTVER